MAHRVRSGRGPLCHVGALVPAASAEVPLDLESAPEAKVGLHFGGKHMFVLETWRSCFACFMVTFLFQMPGSASVVVIVGSLM